MSVEFVSGDLFAADVDALAHGCNCQGMMGAGIAAEFRYRYPKMYEEYRERCLHGAFPLGDAFAWWTGNVHVIFNLATQPTPGPTADLNAVEKSLRAAVRIAEEWDVYSIGLPRIGCGIGGLKWADVRKVIEKIGAETSVRLVVFEEYKPA